MPALAQPRFVLIGDTLVADHSAPVPLTIATRGDKNEAAKEESSGGLLECCSLNWVTETQRLMRESCASCVSCLTCCCR
jgi:hypothetical protein